MTGIFCFILESFKQDYFLKFKEHNKNSMVQGKHVNNVTFNLRAHNQTPQCLRPPVLNKKNSLRAKSTKKHSAQERKIK